MFCVKQQAAVLICWTNRKHNISANKSHLARLDPLQRWWTAAASDLCIQTVWHRVKLTFSSCCRQLFCLVQTNSSQASCNGADQWFPSATGSVVLVSHVLHHLYHPAFTCWTLLRRPAWFCMNVLVWLNFKVLDELGDSCSVWWCLTLVWFWSHEVKPVPWVGHAMLTVCVCSNLITQSVNSL